MGTATQQQHTNPQTHIPRVDQYVWFLFIATWLIGDTTTTIIALELGFRESSALINYGLEFGGYPVFIAGKLTGAILLYALYEYVHRYAIISVGFLGVWAGTAVVWNTTLLLYYSIA